MMHKSFGKFLVIGLLSISLSGIAQEKTESFSRYFLGGSIAAQFGSTINLNVSPHFGYCLLPKLSAGLGFTYQYYSNAMYSPPLTLNIFGGSAFVRYDILDWLYLHAEYELLTYETDMYHPLRKIEQIFSDNFLVGAGYRQLISPYDKDNAYIMLLYNFNETIYTPYTNPVLRMGVEFYF